MSYIFKETKLRHFFVTKSNKKLNYSQFFQPFLPKSAERLALKF